MLRISEVRRSRSEVFASEQYKRIVQHRFHRSAAFAPQSAAVPAERAVCRAVKLH